MKNVALSIVAMAFTSMCVVAQPVQISQATIAASTANRSTNGFPFTISQPGSYILTSNLVVPPNTHGIIITSDNVTLDLNGFTISGPIQCTGSGASLTCTSSVTTDGVFAANTTSNLTVRNGSAVGFTNGVLMVGDGNLVEEIHARGNADGGISIHDGVVRRNTAIRNGGVGIFAPGSTVSENVANFNVTWGLSIGDGGLFGSNTFVGNGLAPVLNIGAVSQHNNSCNGAGC